MFLTAICCRRTSDVLLESMPLEALMQLQDATRRIEEYTQEHFIGELSRILGSQTDDQVAVTTAKAAVPPYDWKAAPKAVSRHDIAGIWVAFFLRCQRYRC